ncbi:MAG: ribonuclease HI [Eubacteriales bacterium]|nr:ribonuclease HI [Eubacteriales bacterium]
MSHLKKVEIYTDGACSKNPGPGGWACVLLYNEHRKDMYGSCADTTNNRMELTAAIMGLKALNESCSVTLYTDSAYLCNAINQGWLANWSSNGWKTAAKKEVENQDLWKEFSEQMSRHNLTMCKVKGHSDNELNIVCDKLAKKGVSECK